MMRATIKQLSTAWAFPASYKRTLALIDRQKLAVAIARAVDNGTPATDYLAKMDLTVSRRTGKKVGIKSVHAIPYPIFALSNAEVALQYKKLTKRAR